MRWLVPDFETVSACNLKAAGAWRYSLDPTTQVLCLSWETDVGGRGSWTPLRGRHDGTEALVKCWIAEGWTFVAHNADFEKSIWRNIMVPTWGWPDIPDELWADSMARCAELALPQKLERAAGVLRLPFQKDTEASKRTIALSSKANQGKGITEADLADTVAYNVSDVDAQKALHRRIGWLTPRERKVWDLSNRVNGRGIYLDLPLVRQMKAVLAEAGAPLEAEFKQITGGLRTSQRDKFMAWLEHRQTYLPNLQKETVEEALDIQEDDFSNASEDDTESPAIMPEDVRRALTIRHLIGSSSVKKLDRMEQVVCPDGRAYGLVAYHAASTGRYAGRLLQPHNFPRGSNDVIRMSIEDKLSLIYGGDTEIMATLFGSAFELIIGSLRHCISAAPGNALAVADFAQIEARIVLALAGQHDKTALLASGVDPYIDNATQIYGRPITKADTKERQTGKNSVLGLGFQMGAPKFQARYAKDQPFEFCQKVVDVYRKEWAPEVPRLWAGLGYAALNAMEDGRADAYGVEYRREDAWLSCLLPSGRKLWYPFPHTEKRHMPWSTAEKPDIRLGWAYHAWKQGQWRKVHAFGGLLTENVVQALARDLLVEAMFKCERENIPVVLTVHDEIVAEQSACNADHKVLEQIMADVPEWARRMQIPVKAEGWTGERYRK